MITSVFLNLIYLFFPLACYFLYLVYSKVVVKNENFIFFDLALFSSYYLCTRFEDIVLVAAFIVNVPVLIAIYKKRFISGVVLSILTAIFLANLYDINMIVFLIQYFFIFVLGYFTKAKTLDVFTICKVLFGTLIAIVPNTSVQISDLGYLTIIWLVMYVFFYSLLKLYERIENVVKMHYSLEQIMKEKTLYESLFKITHEIKNPLAVCKGYLDMFDIRNTAKANKYVGIIDQEIDRTLLLLQDFSNVSKIKINKSIMEVGLLLEDVSDEVSPIFKNKLKFSNLASKKEIYIDGDYNRLKQVLINVIKNAKESIKDKGTVELKSWVYKNKYIITVKDNGEGMDKETYKKLGTPFYTTKKQGTGLGVCFSKEIVERHDGSMKYFSKKNEGTTVKIILPIKKTST